MILISHRGNIDGKNEVWENHPKYIIEALEAGYDVEIDVWYISNNYFLGHDSPEYPTDKYFLQKDGVWCHAKNIDALEMMLKENIHCFWHQNDDVTLTSKGYMWTYPGKQLTEKSICVKPELSDKKLKKVTGICSDFIERYNI